MIAPRAVLAFVGENHGRWIDRTERLALTLRSLRAPSLVSPPIAMIVGGPTDAHRHSLERLGCDVRATTAVDAQHRFMNKLRMLELPEIDGADGLLALDCDLVVLGDPLPLIDPNVVNGYVEQGTNLSDDLWHQVHRALALGVPRLTYRDEVFGQMRYPYFNTGVLWIPTRLIEPTLGEWTRACGELVALADTIPELRARVGLIDQIAFSVAMTRLSHPVRPLPLALNCPTGGFRWTDRPALDRPMILHYHDNVDDRGFLRVPNHPRLRRELDEVNRLWASHRGVVYGGPKRQTLKKRMIRESRTTQRLLQRASRMRRALRV